VTLLEIALLLGWGTLVGVDLVSVGQLMIARPIVAGTIAGLLIGEVEAGIRLGLIFELFQFDILPFGAVRYPEYGPGTVAGVAATHLIGRPDAWGIGAGVGLVIGVFAGASLHWLREANARAVRRAAPALEAGDVRVLARVHLGGLGRDMRRAAGVTALGLLTAWLVSRDAAALPPHVLIATSAAAAGAALAAGVAGLFRLIGSRRNLRWLAAGLAAGTAVLWIA
jgi:PTS system mannose-specific IIC component